METRHIKFNYEDAISGKKSLLSSELNLLQILRKIRNYKMLRKKELTEKTKLKKSLSELKSKIDDLSSTFPKREEKIIEMPKPVKTKKETKHTAIQRELDEIKRKLERLK